MTEMLTMQEYIDDCYYNTERGSLYELGVALPGYRIEEITADGNIGSYGDEVRPRCPPTGGHRLLENARLGHPPWDRRHPVGRLRGAQPLRSCGV